MIVELENRKGMYRLLDEETSKYSNPRLYLTAGPDEAINGGDVASTGNHGTAMYSLIASDRLGHASRANIIFIQYYNRYQYYTTAHLFNAMFLAWDHMMKNKIKEAIISCAWFYDQVQPKNPLFEDVYEPPVQSMRTNSLRPDEYLSPTSESEQYPNIIVPVGGSNRQDRRMFNDIPGSKKVPIKVWAPGEGVHVVGWTKTAGRWSSRLQAWHSPLLQL
ncbi:uncharacterized protein DFL_000744 [Arthrobotrys flagrans]|uniref:Peptidase S8/S53 domain-containing protein n=1 Tax=Arthrobotrys flagrans TaxID=97331 RepID=A0A437AF43_ARTFL|nr:hypothetical protein DFL_000744 [Arthrobotrys flagrans]